MEDTSINPTPLSRYTVSFGLALAITSVVNSLVVIAKESSKAIMDGMKNVMGHHWITHSTFIVLLFVGLGWGLAQMNGGKGVQMTPGKLLTALLAGVILGGLIIVGFYLIGD